MSGALMGRRELDADFEIFVAESWERLWHAAYLLTRDRHDAEDLTQTVLLRAYVSWPRVRRDDAYAYARRALVNGYIDGWRRQRRLRAQPEDARDRDDPQPTDIEAVENCRLVLSVLADVSARERAVLVLRYYFDLSERETARQLGVTVGTVKSTSSRAVAKLRQTAERGGASITQPTSDGSSS